MRYLQRAYRRIEELRARLGMFGNVFGVSLIFVAAVITFGTPLLAHADVGDLVSKLADSSLGLVFRGIAYIILAFSSFILYLVGWLFDLVVNYTVFGFGTYFSVSQGMLSAWSVLRDIANIALIFGFVMIGIAYMLDIHGYEASKTLPRLIIFAVLLNFSLLASEAVIDTSNVFASVLYSKSGAGAACTGNTEDCAKQGNTISGRMLQLTGMTTIYDTNNSLEVPNESISNTTQGMISLGLSIFATIAAVVFLAGAIMLVIRAVVLSFLMVLSPIGFAGLAIPPLEKYAGMWWSKLLSQSFFAPVYLLLIVISIAIGQGITGAIGGHPSFAQALGTDGGGSIQILLIFAIMIGFLIASLIVAKQMGAMGADLAISTGRRVVNGAWAGPRAISSWASRATANTAGSAAERAYNSVITKDNGFTKLMRFSGVDEGIAAGIAKVKGAKFEGKSYADRQKEIEHRGHEIGLIRNRENLSTQIQNLADAKAKGDDGAAGIAQKGINDLAQKMSQSDLETVIKASSEEQIAALGKALSPEKFENVMKSKEVSDDKKHVMQGARFSEVDEKNIKDLSNKDLEQFAAASPDKFQTLVAFSDPDGRSALKEDQLEALGKSDRLSQTQKQMVRQNTIVGRVENLVDGGRTAEATKLALRMTSGQKVKLKAEVLTSDAVIQTFGQQDLDALAQEKKLNVRQVAKVAERLQDPTLPIPKRPDIENYFKENRYAAGLWGWKV